MVRINDGRDKKAMNELEQGFVFIVIVHFAWTHWGVLVVVFVVLLCNVFIPLLSGSATFLIVTLCLWLPSARAILEHGGES
jgi:hypothetical protein